MKHNLRFFTLLIALSTLLANSNAQNPPSTLDALKQFAKNSYSFNQLYPLEKVYLHLDNSSYFQSEAIWFKAYVVKAENNHFTQDSKILYVELLTDKGRVCDRRKLKIENGQCYGEFKLGNDIRTGFYEIRAYTRAMLNFGDDNIFSRIIPIYKRPLTDGDFSEKEIGNRDSHLLKEYRKNKKTKSSKKANINIDFYPEGGHLGLGMMNRVAFKATDKAGKSIDITGRVTNAEGEILTQFATAHDGMGSFDIQVTGQEEVEITYEDKTKKFDLPKALESTYTMRVNNLNQKLVGINISKSPELAPESLGLVVNCRNKPCIFNVIKVEDASLQIPISKTQLSTGVHSITLFKANGEILAERLFFVSQPQAIELKILNDSAQYKPLQEINIALALKNAQGHTTPSNLSVAIKDASSSGVGTYKEDIRSHFLLSSDLKGYIHNVNYYFEKNDISHRYALDLLMMTQGWRSYTWKQMSGVEPIKIKHPIEESLMIKGQLLKPIRDIPIANTHIKFRLSKTGHDGLNVVGKSDENGCFAFLLNDSLGIYNTWDLMLSVPRENTKDKRNRILLDRQFSPQPKVYSPYENNDIDTLVHFSTKKSKKEKRSVEDIQLIKEYELIRHKSELSLPNMVYNVYQETNDLADQGIYFGSTVGGYLEDKDAAITCDSADIYQYLEKKLVFVHSYASDIYDRHTHISDIGIEGVEKIELYLDQHSWENLAEKGLFRNSSIPEADLLLPENSNKFVIALVYTKADKSYKDVPNGMRLTYFDGYSNSKEFAKVVLHKPIIGEIDHRRTLYWNPNVTIDPNGKAQLKFYNNSSCKHILIDAQGISQDGVPLSVQNY